MRLSLLLVGVLTIFSAAPSFASDIPVDSKITAATVYSDRATVSRSAKIKVPAGAHTLVFKNMPVSMFTDSLRASGKAVAKVTFGAVSFKMEAHEDYVVPKEKELSNKLIMLQDARRIAETDKQAILAGNTFLENLGKQAQLRTDEEIAKIELKPETWAAAANSLSEKVAENLRRSVGQDIAMRKIDEEIRKVNDELNQLRTGQKQSFVVSVPLESAAETELSVELSYQQPSVGWSPVYDARYDTKTGKLVWQQTGEDWTDVALTLSTAQPSRGAGLPDLYPQWLSILAPYQPMAEGSGGGGDGMEFSSMAANMTGSAAPMMKSRMVVSDMAVAAEAPMPQDAGYAAAQIDTQGFVGEYKITGPSTVKSDGTQSKLLIGSFVTENATQVQIKPQYSTDAYLVVKAKLKGEAPILPGMVNLFRDNAFIGQTNLPMLRPEDEQELAFGIDDKVTVKRNILKDEQSEAGLVMKDQIIEKHFVTEIKNLHKEDISIAVLETVPTSQDERIRVEILNNVTTEGYEADLHDVKGVTRWRMTLKPEEKTKIDLGWKVSWPKGENISGL
jgi:uncharacterized protein (TIGR02231 family)